MVLYIIPKGSKYNVQDEKGRIIYTIKKKGFGGKMQLFDASGYEMYTITSDFSQKHPSFDILLDGNPYIMVKCKSRFLDPSIVGQGNMGTYWLKSQDRMQFELTKDDVNIGSILSQPMPKGDVQFEMTINDKEFDDALVLFAVCIDFSFYKYKK